MQQRTAERIEDAPQYPEETVEMVTLVLRERVQQRTDEQMVMWPQPSWWSDEDPSSVEVKREMRRDV